MLNPDNLIPDLTAFEVKKKAKPNSTSTESQRAAIEQGAAELGISPIDYATAISYESAGTFDPWKKGPVTQYGVHRGTIQYGEPQRRQYGVYQGQSFEEQVTKSNVKYLKDAGVRPGMTFAQIYAAINGGSASRNLNTPEYMIKNGKRVPTGRTIADNVRNAERDHRAKVIKRFGFDGNATGLPDLTEFEVSIPDLSAYETQSATTVPSTDPLPGLPSNIPVTDPSTSQLARPKLLPRGYAAEPVIGPEEPSVDLALQPGIGQPVYDNTVLGVVDVDPSMSPAEKIRYAGSAVLGRFKVTPDQVDKWINESGDNAFRGDPNAAKVSITAQMLAQIVGPEQAQFLVDSELTDINQETSALPQITRDDVNKVAGWESRLLPFAAEGAGHTSEYLAGSMRLLSPEFWAGTEGMPDDRVRAYAPNRLLAPLKEHGRLTRSNAEFFNDGSLSTELLRIGGNATSDLPRTIAQMALPGGVVTASAADMAAQAAGRGETPKEIRNSAAKGAILGAIAKAAYPVGRGIATNTGSRVAGGAGALAFTGAATYPTSTAFGATPEEALKESVYNSVFAVADAVPVLAKSLPDLTKYETGTQGKRGFANEPSTYESTPNTSPKVEATQAAQNLKASTPDIEAALGSPKARTARNLRANLAESARSFDQAHQALKDAREVFANQKPEQNFDFIHRFEHMLPEDSWQTPLFPQPNLRGVIPEGQLEIATTLRSMLDEARDRVRSLGIGSLNHYYANYFPHLFEQPNEVQGFIDKQLSGTRGFLKERKFPTFREALDAGFKPISTNPVDLALTRINDLNRYAAGQKTVKFLRQNNYIKQVKNGEVPEGMEKLPDNVAGPDHYAVPGAAKILNNFLSPSLHRFKGFRAYRMAGNFMTQANLSFSLFHLGNVTLDSVTSKLALGMEQLATGKPLRAGKSFAEGLIPGYAPLQNLIKGDKVLQQWDGRSAGPVMSKIIAADNLLKEWLSPGSSNDPAMNKIAELLQEAGGRGSMDDFWHTRMSRQFKDHLKQSEYFKATLKAFPALLDKMSEPVMQYLVPRMKLAAFLDLAKQELDRLGPDASPEVIRESMQRSWDSVENRLGEATMDNYFWNNTVKNIGMASFQSLGWQLGALREFGGAVKDTATAPKRLVKNLKGEKTATPVVTHRMAYVPAVVMSTGLYGAMTQYLLTGEAPENVRDLFFPRDGRTDEKGQPARVNLPTFLKDVYAVSNAPFSTASHKLHPLPRVMAQLATNMDYFSNEIRDPNDPAMDQLKDMGKHAASSFLPYSVKGAQQNIKRGAGTRDTILPFLGIAPAPKSINDPWTPAENIVKDFNRVLRNPTKLVRKVSNALTPAPVQQPTPSPTTSRLKSQYIEEVKSGKDVHAEMQKAVKAGVLKADEVTEIYNTAKDYLVKGVMPLNLDQALEVYEAANEQERGLLYTIMITKMDQNADTLTPAQITKLKKLELY